MNKKGGSSFHVFFAYSLNVGSKLEREKRHEPSKREEAKESQVGADESFKGKRKKTIYV